MSQNCYDNLPKELRSEVKNRHIILHVRIKPLMQNFSANYHLASMQLIKLFEDLQPKSIIIPSFTYSFTKSLVFNLQQSPSETGRFSEEVRLALNNERRTKDPIFSILDYLDFGFHHQSWNSNAFGKESIWHFLSQENALIINIGLEQIISTHIHFIEQQFSVPYRENIQIQGETVDSHNTQKINYQYFARNLELDPKWDRTRLLSELKMHKILHEEDWNSTNIRWFSTKKLSDYLNDKIANKPDFLLR